MPDKAALLTGNEPGVVRLSGRATTKATLMGFPFSSRTIAVLVRAIDAGYTDTHIGTLILEAEADSWAPDTWQNKQARLQTLLKMMRRDGSDDARRAALELARLVLVHGEPRSEWSEPTSWFQEVLQALAADGWEYDTKGHRLVPRVPEVDVVEEIHSVSVQLQARGWQTSAGHYDQAVDAVGRGNWASANAQLRSTLEDLLPLVAERLTGHRPSNVQNALQKLQSGGHLANGEFSFSQGLWQMCQSSGSHPGLSDAEESRFRLTCVTAYLRYVLDRLPK